MNAFLSNHKLKLQVSEWTGSEVELQISKCRRWVCEGDVKDVVIPSTDWHLQISSLIKGPEWRQQL